MCTFVAPGFAADNVLLDEGYTSLALTAEEQQYLLHKRYLSMCVDPDNLPYEKLSKGQHIGIVADYMHLFAQKINIPIVVVPALTQQQSIKLGKQRKCDIFSLLMATPERKEYLDFTEAYLSFPLVVAVAFQQDFIANIDEILNKKLGIEKGVVYIEQLRLLYPGLRLEEVESMTEGLNKVSRKQLYGMIASLPDISYAFQTGYIGELKIAGKLTQHSAMGVATRNDEPLLVGIFNKAIAQLSEQEQYRITNHWIAIKYESRGDNSILIWVMGMLGLILTFFLYHFYQLRKCNNRLQYLSITDKLTGLNNRTKLDQKLEKAFHLGLRYQHKFSIILIDIDHFKKVNDQYGHLIGDYALKTLAQMLSENIRAVDTLGRWGGEEFLIICPEQTIEGVWLMAEKLRKLIDQYPFENFPHLSCSFGLAAYAQDQSIEKLLKRADKALYCAKNQGRNQVSAS